MQLTSHEYHINITFQFQASFITNEIGETKLCCHALEFPVSQTQNRPGQETNLKE